MFLYFTFWGKKYGYDLFGEGARERWGMKSLVEAQLELKLEAKLEL